LSKLSQVDPFLKPILYVLSKDTIKDYHFPNLVTLGSSDLWKQILKYNYVLYLRLVQIQANCVFLVLN